MVDELPHGITSGSLALALLILVLWIMTLLVIHHDKKHNTLNRSHWDQDDYWNENTDA